MRERFWERFPLEQLTEPEWEALCDGCGRCCLVKLEDEDSGELFYTSLACRYLDHDSCRCTAYAERTRKVEDCVQITAALIPMLPGLPETCAYLRLSQGESLLPWHPLISGDPQSVARAGISVRGRVSCQSTVAEDDYQEHVINWVG